MIKVQVTKNLIAREDLLVGLGTAIQRRGNQDVVVTKINAGNFPYDQFSTLAEKVEEINEQYEYFMANRELLLAAVAVQQLFQALSVNIDDLALWLTNGSNQLSAFQPMAQRVTQDEILADNVNYFMLEDTIIDEDVTITLGVNTELFVLKGEEYIP